MLYQEVRPTKLEHIFGNDSIVAGLKKVVKSHPKDRPHALLLHGPSGCGKTTIARILASEFGCGKLSLFEVNAANTRGIETIRDVSKRALLRPLDGEASVFILDESHQLTQAAQQGLLKAIEDCPIHIYFIFCTTEPDNIIKTIRNRCAKYQVSVLGKRELYSLLSDVTDTHGFGVSDEVLEAIAEICDGSPRAALVELEKVMDLESIDDQFDILQAEDENTNKIWDLTDKLLMSPAKRKSHWKDILNILDSLEGDSEGIRKAMLSSLSKYILRCDDQEIAEDVAKLMRIFSVSTYYGGKPQLVGQMINACLLCD